MVMFINSIQSWAEFIIPDFITFSENYIYIELSLFIINVMLIISQNTNIT